MSNSNQENNILAPCDLNFFLEGVSAVSNLASQADALHCIHPDLSSPVWWVSLRAWPWPPSVFDAMCTWLGLSGMCKLCVVLQVGVKVWDRGVALRCTCPIYCGSRLEGAPAESPIPVWQSFPIPRPAVPGMLLECDLSQTWEKRGETWDLLVWLFALVEDWAIVMPKVLFFPPQEVYTSLWNCSGAQRATH